MGAHNRVYVVGDVRDWESYVRRTKGKANVKLVANSLAAHYLTIHPWDRLVYGAGFVASEGAEKEAMMRELRLAAERGKRVEL